ncbi:MAG: PDZ domain-containing protein, partial [Saprospiraceae bacterium]|nr:PDZ domain-containing protein [Saprospiraceae bacterium]
MKRLFLSLNCSFALLAFMANSLAAQEAATPSTLEKKVVVIQKTENADGTMTVKKKSFDKGQSAETYMEELNLDNPIESVREVIIMTGDDATKESGEAETIIMIRKGSNKTEIKWDSKDGELPVLHFDDLQLENRKQDRHRSEMALIGDNEPKPFLGIYPERHENGGVLVTDIVPGTGAADAGIRSGDIITSIDGLTLASRGGLSGTLSNYKPGDNISVTFLRDGQSMTTNVTLGERKEERHQVYNYNHNYNYNYNYNYDYKFERNP